MAKKNRKHTPHSQAQALSSLFAEELKSRGEQYLLQQKYQDALLSLKELIKREANDDHLLLLAKAYIGRIKQLAEKSMVKEALALVARRHRLPWALAGFLASAAQQDSEERQGRAEPPLY